MTQASVHSHAVDASGLVRLGVPCRDCGYNLRSLHESGKCPECGAPVELSLNRSLLRFSSAAWVRGLWIGTTINFVGWSIPAVLPILIAIDVASGRSFPWIVFFAPACMLLAATLVFLGSWLVTSPEPSREDHRDLTHPEAASTQRTIRHSAMVIVVALVLMLFGLVDPVAMILGGLVLFGGLIVVAAWHMGMIPIFSSLLCRVPDLDLAASAERLRVYFMGCPVIFFVMILMGFIHIGFGLIVAPFVLISGIIAWIAYLIVLFRMMRRFQREYHAALLTHEMA